MVRKTLPVVLFFYAGTISQAQVLAVDEALTGNDVRYRKVIKDVDRDILEEFDALAGEPPARYLAVAAEKGKKVLEIKLNGEGDTADQASAPNPDDTKDDGKTVTPPTTPTAPPPVPADATKPPAPAAVTPPPKA